MNSSADYLSIILNDIPLMDVRAPIEHIKGSINNATNLPLMTDREREQVGTCYKEQGQENAIKLGRELVTEQKQRERTKQWIEFCNNFPKGYLFCFRGGLRSRITQQWIQESGVNYPYIEGGYKALRRFLIDELELSVATLPMMLISGRTGCGKTRLLKQLPNMVDLEGLAHHKGSSFGATIDPQPALIDFENSLSSAFLKHRHKHKRTVFLEDEGRLIGSLTLPLSLKTKMTTLPHIELTTDIEQRIDFAIEDYVDALLASFQLNTSEAQALEALADRHRQSLTKIRKRLGAERYVEAQALLENAISLQVNQNTTSGYRDFIHLLLTQYYDPMYDYQLSKKTRHCVFKGNSSQIIDYINHHHL
jgi:tRNA 2-selenouridine synthase